MTDERRYREEEIEEIFEAASTPDPTSGAPASRSFRDGLTIAELQAIGEEVGLPPARIADAAAALELRTARATPRRTHLGMRISAAREVPLPRAPTDREWETLVGELRRTFGAQGRDHSSGNLREWRNGNLHACVEATESGYRLRLGTVKGNAMPVNWMALFGLVVVALIVKSGEAAGDAGNAILLGGLSVAALGWNAVRLPIWANERERQMEHIAGRIRALIAEDREPDDTLGS